MLLPFWVAHLYIELMIPFACYSLAFPCVVWRIREATEYHVEGSHLYKLYDSIANIRFQILWLVYSVLCYRLVEIHCSPQNPPHQHSAGLNEGQSWGQTGCDVRPVIPPLPSLLQAEGKIFIYRATKSGEQLTMKYLRT